MRAAEKIRGGSWERWADRYGDWGRDGVMYVAVRHGGMRLAEVVREVGIEYQAGAQAVKRFGQALGSDPARRQFVGTLRREISNV
ncbi:MAG: hypothetical protein GX456_00745 [Verrucomicrobia bacterium]|nr:hypothetical protein [Verrucomicrobiota bacterium]